MYLPITYLTNFFLFEIVEIKINDCRRIFPVHKALHINITISNLCFSSIIYVQHTNMYKISSFINNEIIITRWKST